MTSTATTSPGSQHTALVFGERIPLTRKNQVRAPTLKGLVTRRHDLTITMYREFDGMIDGSRIVDMEVSPRWLCVTLLDVVSKSRCIAVERPLGAATIDVSNAVYGVTIHDAEYDRRKALLANLPKHDASTETRLLLESGRPLTIAAIHQARTAALAKIEDPMAFDDAVDLLRSLTAVDELAAYLSHQNLLPRFAASTSG